MQRREQSMMIGSESVQALLRKVVDIFKTKQTQQEACNSHTHTLRYAISTKQMQDLNTLTYRNSIELNTQRPMTYQYLKSP